MEKLEGTPEYEEAFNNYKQSALTQREYVESVNEWSDFGLNQNGRVYIPKDIFTKADEDDKQLNLEGGEKRKYLLQAYDKYAKPAFDKEKRKKK